MMRHRPIMQLVALVAVLAVLYIAVFAVAGMAQNQPGAAMPPVGTPSQITQRGHVNNMCEAQIMLDQLVQQQGGQQVSGDYRVVYVLDAPKGWYMPGSNGQLTWRNPARGENQHIEATVFDSLTGKMLPITPTVDVIDQQGKVVQSKKLTYLWHPMIDHYGANYSIPTAGTYTLRVRGEAPSILRHSRTLGNRFCAPVDVQFASVTITPRQPDAAEVATTTPGSTGAAGGSTSSR